MENETKSEISLEKQVEILNERFDLLNARIIGLSNDLMRIQPWINNVNIHMQKTVDEIIKMQHGDDFASKLMNKFTSQTEV